MPPRNEPTVAGMQLRTAVRAVMQPDPWLPQVDVDTVESVAMLVEGMAEVSRRRRENLAREPWKLRTELHHLEHATAHIDAAFAASVDGETLEALDREDGLPHLLHCALRLAFTFARQNGVGGPP
jgi:hypothetical protein